MHNRSLSRLFMPWLALAVLILSGCATGPATLHAELSSYNDWTSVPADKTYTFTRSLRAKDSLEMNAYEALVKDELGKLGFSESADPAKAKLAVTLRPLIAVENGGYRNSFYYDPFWSPYWPGRAVGFYGPRPFYHGFYPYYSPLYDLNREPPTYLRQLRLEIDLQAVTPRKRVYEGTVQAEGWDDSLPKAMPYLVRALFSDFPGNNGATRSVDVLMEK